MSVSHLTLQRSMSSQSVQALPQSRLFLRCRHLLTSARATAVGRRYLCRSPLWLLMGLDGQLASESQGNSRCSPCIRHLLFILYALQTACSLTRRAVRLRESGSSRCPRSDEIINPSRCWSTAFCVPLKQSFSALMRGTFEHDKDRFTKAHREIARESPDLQVQG
eukprot:COSAG02_NODE_6141_length_3773_cov_1.478498_2_plen_165_part_00